jgi:hypothetical protein
MFEPTSATRVAIEFLTLRLEPGERAQDRAAAHIVEVIHDPHGPGADSVVAGLLNLNMMQLMQLVKERGATAETMTQEAGEYLRELSRQLPE